MTLRLLGPLVAALSLSGCAQYPRVLMEFDSVTQFDQVEGEPEQLEYQNVVRRWPWVIRQLEGSGLDVFFGSLFGARPGPITIDNPSAFTRERMLELAAVVGDDLLQVAEVASRCLWVAARDPETLNQLVAMDCLTALLAASDVDPIRISLPPADRTRAVAEVTADLEVLRDVAPGRRYTENWNATARARYAGALVRASAMPAVQLVDQRRLIRTLAEAARSESDVALIEPTHTALVDAIGNGLADGLRRKLLAPEARVREEAAVHLYRLSGPRAVPFFLRVMSRVRPGAVSGVNRRTYDTSVAVRRTTVRLCGQLRGEDLDARWRGGPSPLEFLYDTVRFDPDEGLRLIALEAMAISLGRPVSFEPEWAHQWWRDRASIPSGGTE